jgi:hypothetical protein
LGLTPDNAARIAAANELSDRYLRQRAERNSRSAMALDAFFSSAKFPEVRHD